MQSVLNFSESEKKHVAHALANFEKKSVKEKFEEMRCEIEGCTVTLYTSGKLVIQGANHEAVRKMLMERLKLREGEIVFGIDEVGRGEGTGPFVVAGVLGETDKLRELRDSKKTSNYKEKSEVVTRNSLASSIVALNAEFIDILRERGLTLDEIECEVINSMEQLFSLLEKSAKVKTDGLPLKGCSNKVEFIVKGDDKEPVIGAASVLAKHFREESSDKAERKTWKNAKG